MPSVKSLVIRVEIDQAKKSHACQASKHHPISKGDLRLKVRNGRSWDHYCRTCAEKIITLDIEKLIRLKAMKPTLEIAASTKE